MLMEDRHIVLTTCAIRDVNSSLQADYQLCMLSHLFIWLFSSVAFISSHQMLQPTLRLRLPPSKVPTRGRVMSHRSHEPVVPGDEWV